MFHQYDPFFENPRYWVEEEKCRGKLLKRELTSREYGVSAILREYVNNKKLSPRDAKKYISRTLSLVREKFERGEFKFEYQEYRLVFRHVARSTDERTMISCIVPKNVLLGDSVYFLKTFSYVVEDGGVIRQVKRRYEDLLYLMALFNSFVIDYYIRLRVSANLNAFYIYELPIPEVDEKLKREIVDRAFRLLYRKEVYDDMAKVLGMKVKEIKDENERRELRAELEIIIAKNVFGLAKDDIEYILSTFVYGNPDKELMKMIVEKFDLLPALKDDTSSL
jgi:hypothetical protein